MPALAAGITDGALLDDEDLRRIGAPISPADTA
jgi:hypothetical protein